jgi:hypothetical protein
MRRSVYRVLSALAPALLAFAAGCYEHAPRRGPLAALADSLVDVAGRGACLAIPAEHVLPGDPAHASCPIGPDTAAFYDVDRTGRVLRVVRNWASDSVGRAEAARVRQQLTSQFGAPTYAGDDTHGNQVYSWETAALCVGLYEGPLARGRGFQLNYRLRDLRGGQCMRG